MTTQSPMLRLDNQICFAIYATAHAFNRTYKPLLDPLGLTYPQYLVMMVLWERSEVKVKEIGARLDLDSGTLSPLLKRLEKQGLVERRRNEGDERQVLIRLTEDGRKLEAEAQSVMPVIARTTGCSLAELSSLKDTLHRLRRNLLAAQETEDPAA